MDMNALPAFVCGDVQAEAAQLADKLLVALVSMAARSSRRQADLWAVMKKFGLVPSNDLLWAAVKALKNSGQIHKIIPLSDGGVLISVTGVGMATAAANLPEVIQSTPSRSERREYARIAHHLNVAQQAAVSGLKPTEAVPAAAIGPLSPVGARSAFKFGAREGRIAERARTRSEMDAVEVLRDRNRLDVERAIAAMSDDEAARQPTQSLRSSP